MAHQPLHITEPLPPRPNITFSTHPKAKGSIPTPSSRHPVFHQPRSTREAALGGRRLDGPERSALVGREANSNRAAVHTGSAGQETEQLQGYSRRR